MPPRRPTRATSVLFGAAALVVLLALPPAAAAPRAPQHEREQRIAFSQTDYLVQNAALDPLRGYALFITETYPSSIIRVRLSDFARAGSLVIDPAIGIPRSTQPAATLTLARGPAPGASCASGWPTSRGSIV